jgi:hypothetical protein
MTTRLTWPQVHTWRLARQFDVTDPVAAVRRLCGVQAQVLSAAELAVTTRIDQAHTESLAATLARGELVRTWAMRGTLHVLHPVDAAAVLALMADARTWTRPSWQKSFLSTGELDRLTEAVAAALADGVPRTREDLVEHVRDGTGDGALAAAVASSWGAALKPLAWQGLLCHGPPEGNRITFTRPQDAVRDWPGPVDADTAARHMIESYLGAFGPADPARFDAWLLRGATSRPRLRQWFDDLGDRLCAVDVDGQRLLARTADVDALATTRPADTVRLLPAFDQFVLGPGTADAHLLPPQHRTAVSRAGGWISPVVASAHGIVGTWGAEGSSITVQPFEDAPALGPDTLAREIARVEHLLRRYPAAP